MAMSKEDQKAASDRIMEKFPLTEEERGTYEYLMLKPPYGSSGDTRVCRVCGAVFQEIPATKEMGVVPALEQFSDHSTIHQTPAPQWTEAYNRMQEAKEAAKKNAST